MKTGYAPGVWDLLHVGHVRFLQTASDQCDHLIVGICSDECVMDSKGERPVVDEVERSFLVSALGCTAGVRMYHDINQTDLLRDLEPDVIFLGPEYGTSIAQSKTLDACKRFGISVTYLPRTEGVSTTERRLHAAGG